MLSKLNNQKIRNKVIRILINNWKIKSKKPGGECSWQNWGKAHKRILFFMTHLRTS